MKVGTITEAGAELIHRGLKFAEADIIKFRTSAEARGFKHTVDECNEQLKLLRGNGADAGLLSVFAPQSDLFDAGRLDGAGESDAGGQLALEDEVVDAETDPETTWAPYVPRPRPKRGDTIIFPDNTTATIGKPLGWKKDQEVFEVEALEADAAEGAHPLLFTIIYENGEWRDSDIAAENGYAERNEQQINEASRKLASDTATDADVSVNSETAHSSNGAEPPAQKRRGRPPKAPGSSKAKSAPKAKTPARKTARAGKGSRS